MVLRSQVSLLFSVRLCGLGGTRYILVLFDVRGRWVFARGSVAEVAKYHKQLQNPDTSAVKRMSIHIR